MKVLLLNGSTRKNGCTFLALKEVANTLEAEGIETEIVQIGSKPIHDCAACGYCGQSHGECVFKSDDVNAFIAKAKHADGFVFGSPVYYAHASGAVLSFLDRAFYAGGSNFTHKPAAAVVTARRAGTTASLDDLNKYMTINQMPIVASTYWNMVFGPSPDKVPEDKEGLQSMRNLGRNMAWVLKCIEAGKNAGIEAPEAERGNRTNFNK